MAEANKYMLLDTAVALAVAFMINVAVISCFAEIFFSEGLPQRLLYICMIWSDASCFFMVIKIAQLKEDKKHVLIMQVLEQAITLQIHCVTMEMVRTVFVNQLV